MGYGNAQYGGGFGITTPVASINVAAQGSGSRVYAGVATPTVLVPPVNDRLVDAIIITSDSGSVSFTNANATTETNELTKTSLWTDGIGTTIPSVITIFGTKSIWYTWTAPQTARYYFNTFGTEFGTLGGGAHPNTVLTVFNSAASITALGVGLMINDDCYTWPHFSDTGRHQGVVDRQLSFAPFDAVSGSTYLIRVAGYSSTDEGTGTLNWGLVGPNNVPVQGDVFVNGPAVEQDSSSVTMAMTTSLTLTYVTSYSSGGMTLPFELTMDSAGDNLVSFRGLGESQTVLRPSLDMTFTPTVTTGTAALASVFTLTHSTSNNTAMLVVSLDMTSNGSTYISPPGTPTPPDPTVDQPLDDSIDVPFETTTGVRVSSSATLSFVYPPDTLANDLRKLLFVAPVMKTPVIIQGRPLQPQNVIYVSSQLQANVYAAPKPSPLDAPTTGPNEGRKIPKYRWVASQFPFPYGVYGDHWPAVGTGPSWTSKYPYRPRREQFEGKVDYDNVVLFWWNYVEHMIADINLPQPYMFQVVGFLHGGNNDQHHHLLDQSNRDLAHIPDVDTPNGGTSAFNEGAERALMHFRPTQVQQAAPTIYTASHQIMHKPTIYTGVFNGTKSFIDIDTQGYRRRVRGNTGTNGLNNALLGRQNGHISPYHASHMSILEINVYSFAPTDAQLNELHKHHYGVYQLDKW